MFIINTLNIYDFFDSLTSLINVNYIIPHPTIDYLSKLLITFNCSIKISRTLEDIVPDMSSKVNSLN